MKKRKKKQLDRDTQSLRERVRCNIEIINKIIETGKAYKEKERLREEKEQIQNRDERLKNGGVKQKDKEKEERTRSGGGRGRSRDSR